MLALGWTRSWTSFRAFKRLPRRQPKANTAPDGGAGQHRLFAAYINAQTRDRFNAEQQAETLNAQAGGKQTEIDAGMDWIRARGRLPTESKNAKDVEGRAECKVAIQLRRMRYFLLAEEQEELATTRETRTSVRLESGRRQQTLSLDPRESPTTVWRRTCSCTAVVCAPESSRGACTRTRTA